MESKSVECNIDINTVTICQEMQIGENLCLEYSSDAISDKLLVAFNRMNRDNQNIEPMVQDILNSIKQDDLNTALSKITNTFVLCFLTRYCRGGKGEKSLFYTFFSVLAKTFPESAKLLCGQIANYGYWKDCFVIIAKSNLQKDIVCKIIDIVVEQLRTDLRNVRNVSDTERINISVLSKWMPREGKALYSEINTALRKLGMNSIIVEIMSRLKPDKSFDGSTVRKYRKILATLSKHIPIVEQQMCEKHFADIKFDSVPSVALDRYKSAFSMESVSALPKNKRISKQQVDRFATMTDEDRQDREQCKQNFSKHMINGKVNGSQIAIEKLVEGVFNTNCLYDSVEEFVHNNQLKLALAQRQFESYVEFVKDQLVRAESESKKALNDETFKFDISNIKCMTDVSGSMSGIPMYVAIGLTLVLLRLQKLKCEDACQTFITFETNPTVVNISRLHTFPKMVQQTKSAPWGGSTDFVKAFDKIMKECGQNIANAPKQLLVLSDMQFNSSLGHSYSDYRYGVSTQSTIDRWETMYDTICHKWRAWFGLDDEQSQANLPTIIFWNLRGVPSGSPVDCTTKGVIQVSGYSASLLKMLLFGQELIVANEQEKPDPSQVLVRTLKASEYDPIRYALGWNCETIPQDSVFVQEVKQFLSEQLTDVQTVNTQTNDIWESQQSYW
jgi:hypothetical protein